MISIIIDFSKIILKSKLNLLNKKIKPFPKKLKHNIGLVLTIPNIIYSKLLNKKAGEDRVHFINSIIFVNSIIDYTYLQYETNLKICELYEPNTEVLSSILDSILHYLPNDFIISITIPIENKKLYKQLIYESFKNPFISNKSKLDLQFQNDMLILNKINNITSYDATNEVDFVIKKYKTKSNILRFKMTNITIKKLRYFSKIGNSINNDGTITQKETVGCFKIQKMNKNFIYLLEIDDGKTEIGSEEEVNIVNCHFSFHSHPVVLYDVYNFDFGWPSNSDYLVYLKSVEHHTIFHIVIANEGIYIISLSKEWSKSDDLSVSKKLEKFILNRFGFPKTKSHLTPQKYIKEVNSIKFEDKKIFNVEFKDWSKISESFSVFEPKLFLSSLL